MNEHANPAPPESGVASDLQQLRADFAKLSESVSGLVKTQAQSAAIAAGRMPHRVRLSLD